MRPQPRVIGCVQFLGFGIDYADSVILSIGHPHLAGTCRSYTEC